MKIQQLMLIAGATIFLSKDTMAQNNRLNIKNSIGWYGYFGTVKVSKKQGIHMEYQWRRNNFVTHWQQGLLRLGVNHSITPRILFRVGYAWAETYAYGEIPLNGLGRDFTEHRVFEMIQIGHNEGFVDFTHRFMLEQRFIGRYSSAVVLKEDEFPFVNRARYMIRLQAPLKGKEIKDKTPYAVMFDEVLVGFGKNVNVNVFDQNRIAAFLGYRFNKNCRLEGGYINQLLQYGRQINGKNVFQNNSGLVINGIFNIEL
jgi:hypothetical protein